jgi:type I restriction enzyme S subunit
MDARLVPFADLLGVVIDNRGRTCPVADSGIPLIATNCLRSDFLYPSYDNVRYVSQETCDNWFRGHPRPGDLIFVTKGTPGRVCMAPDPGDFCIAQDMVAVRADQSKIYPKYLFALLRSAAVQNKIEQMHVGTLIPHFKKGDFDKLLLPVPDPKAQQVIGDLYFDFSAKIELNRRMNETLEAMASAIFKSWFVDFDPVRAKSEGRQPFSTDVETAALFPNCFENSELGKIPKGWKVSTLGSICEVIDCLHSRKPDRQESGKPLLQLWNIRDNGLIDMNDTYWITPSDYEAWISRMEATAGDCVITNVVRVGAVAQIPNGLKAALGRNMTGIRCRESFPFPTFLIECLLSDAMREEISVKTDSGTILDSLNVRNIPRLRLIEPTLKVSSLFETTRRPLRERMERNHAESETLADVRDPLLPKLISGEIRIKDVEKMVGRRKGLTWPNLSPNPLSRKLHWSSFPP